MRGMPTAQGACCVPRRPVGSPADAGLPGLPGSSSSARTIHVGASVMATAPPASAASSSPMNLKEGNASARIARIASSAFLSVSVVCCVVWVLCVIVCLVCASWCVCCCLFAAGIKAKGGAEWGPSHTRS